MPAPRALTSAQRIEKENAVAEKFWNKAVETAHKVADKRHHHDDTASVAGSQASSTCPSNYTSKTSVSAARKLIIQPCIRVRGRRACERAREIACLRLP